MKLLDTGFLSGNLASTENGDPAKKERSRSSKSGIRLLRSHPGTDGFNGGFLAAQLNCFPLQEMEMDEAGVYELLQAITS